jgi:hypothetical protein
MNTIMRVGLNISTVTIEALKAARESAERTAEILRELRQR